MRHHSLASLSWSRLQMGTEAAEQVCFQGQRSIYVCETHYVGIICIMYLIDIICK